MDIDKRNFTREYCRSRLKCPIIWKILLYSGAMTMFLDYQVWTPVFRLWHPLSWVVLFLTFCIGGIQSCYEFIKENKPSSPDWKKCTYWKAPKKKV